MSAREGKILTSLPDRLQHILPGLSQLFKHLSLGALQSLYGPAQRVQLATERVQHARKQLHCHFVHLLPQLAQPLLQEAWKKGTHRLSQPHHSRPPGKKENKNTTGR